MNPRKTVCRWLGSPAFAVVTETVPGRWEVTVETPSGVLVHRDSAYGTPMLAARRVRKLKTKGGPVPVGNMRRVQFTTGEGGLTIRGWTDGETWNGWACPWFDRESGEALCRWLDRTREEFPDSFALDEPEIAWDASRQAFVSMAGVTVVWVSPVRTLVGGALVYQVMDGWTWEEVAG